MRIANLAFRAVLTGAAVMAVRAVDTAHEIVSPLVSGPMAAQQLTDSNVAYMGTQVTSRLFDGSGVSSMITLPILIAVLIAIWYKPVKSLFTSNEKVN